MTSRIDINDTIRDYELRHGITDSLDEHQTKDIVSDDTEFDSRGEGFTSYIKKCKTQSFAGDFVSDISLSGHSSNGKASCGKSKKLKGCLEKEFHKSKMVHVKKALMSCNSKGCNVCFDTAIKREALSVKNRMITFANLKNNRKIYLKKNRVRLLSHLIISIPKDQYYKALTPDGRKELNNTQRIIMRQFKDDYNDVSVDGGATIFHPYRFTKKLENAYLSPHFHNIISGWIDLGKVKEIYKQTGWIVHLVFRKKLVEGKIKKVSVIETEQEAYNLSAYLLSHVGVYEKKVGSRSSEHSVSYFGECQNSKFKVDSILSRSMTGYEQIDKILYSKKEKTVKGIDYKLQTVHYTHSTMLGSIKDSINEYHVEDGNMQTLTKAMRPYIIPHTCIDYPAISQSDLEKEQEREPLQFLQMRFDYISPTSIVQSEYLTIILDSSIEEICPECSLKLRTLVPNDWSPEQANHFKEVVYPMLQDDSLTALDTDCGLQYLSKETLTGLGMPYFKLDGMMDYETGIYTRPECIDRLNPTISSRIIKNIGLQTFKYQFKIENGRSPTKEEQEEYLTPTIKRSTKSQRLSDY